ncbi:hypothetical protein V6N13_064125 [Hibiscus sabdariffa]
MVRQEMVSREHVGERSLDVNVSIVRHDIEVTQESENAYHMLDIAMVDPLENVEPQLALITTPKVEFLQYNGRYKKTSKVGCKQFYERFDRLRDR